MRIAVANYSTPSFAKVKEVTVENQSAYCSKWGYDYIQVVRDSGYTQLFCDRIIWYIELLKSGKWDWIAAIDSDILFTNFGIQIESIVDDSYHAVLSRDALQIVSGDMLLRCTPECAEWLEAISLLYRFYQPPKRNEQWAMEDMMNRFGSLIKIVPQKVMSSYNYDLYKALGGNYAIGKDVGGNDGRWAPGDFKFHCPACPDRKAAILKEMLPKVIR